MERRDSVPPLLNLDDLPAAEVPLSSLVISDLPRLSGENFEHARILAESYEQLPPIIVHRSTMRVLDGMHRLRAAKLRGEEKIGVHFVDGDDASSFVLAVRMNVKHGLPLSAKDRKAAAARIIELYPRWSDRMIASVVGLSAKTVAGTRRHVTGEEYQLSSRIGRDGRIRPGDSAERRERARKLMADNPNASLRKVAQLAGISAETVRSVRARLDCGETNGQHNNGKSIQLASQPKPPGRRFDRTSGESPSQFSSLRALKADPAFRSTENGRSILRMLIAQRTLTQHGEQLIQNIPEHCADWLIEAAQECADSWRYFACRLAEQQGQNCMKRNRTGIDATPIRAPAR